MSIPGGSAVWRFVGSSPRLNPLLRSIWQPAASVFGLAKTRFPVTGKFALELPGGGQLWLDTEQHDYEFTKAFWQGFGQSEATNFSIWRKLCRSARTILDIGAHVGLYSTIAALDNPGAKVHAFEPVPGNLRALRKIARANRVSFDVHEIAVSDVAGTIDFFIPKTAYTRESSLHSGFRPDCDRVSVPTQRLDDLHLQDIDLIKLDVETAEARVVQGGRETLRNQRPIILCEILYNTGESRLWEAMAGLNYRFNWISGAALKPQEELRPDPTYEFKDYLLVPEERQASVIADLAGIIAAN